MILFRVKSDTDIKKLGGAIFTNIKNCDMHKMIELWTIIE